MLSVVVLHIEIDAQCTVCTTVSESWDVDLNEPSNCSPGLVVDDRTSTFPDTIKQYGGVNLIISSPTLGIN